MSEENTEESKTVRIPEEVSLEDAEQANKLKDLLAKKAEEKLQLEGLKELRVLKKSKFYYGPTGDLREHIASYKGYAIFIKQERIKEDLNDKEVTMFPALVALSELKLLKKVNGNIVRKLNPNSIHEYEKMAVVQAVVVEIDKGV